MLSKSGVKPGNGGGMSDSLCDVIVLGAGPTGENVADRAVKGGLKAMRK
jgi:hypothetical protein